MTQIHPAQAHPAIRWQPLCALAGVNGAVTLSWIIYRAHLAGLLTQAGFPGTWAPIILLVESVLAIGIEPLAGLISDQTAQQRQTRFPVILLGVISTAVLFISIPLLIQGLQPRGGVADWVPAVLLLWGIAISLFRAPALALLDRYAPLKLLPIAASAITLMGALASSATPLASPLILSFGPVASFILAGVLILVSGGWLRSTSPDTETGIPRHAVTSPSWAALGWIFGVGFGVTLAFRLTVEWFPKVLQAQLPTVQPPLLVGLLFISLAVTALVAGKWAVQLGNHRVMLSGIGIAAALLLVMPFSRSVAVAILLALALGIAFSLVFNGTLPFALESVPPQSVGLGVGMFFSGAATAISVHSGVLNQLKGQSLSLGIGLGLLALLVAGLCLMGRTQRPLSRELENG
ncbi:MAG: MFS transporter [Synechococcales cyanobacterium M58_A2018_015]|nr:MFS transporter [Synechococcales cyanobacterium M58_A2018_015]